MKYAIFVSALFGLSACDPAAPEAEPTVPIEKSSDSLVTYDASEFEPNWFLKLTGGDTLAFTQLDPIAGNDLVTYQYAVTQASDIVQGWNILGTGPNGNITLNIKKEQKCIHSGSGYTHRDTVIVTISDQQQLKGCGGPILDEG